MSQEIPWAHASFLSTQDNLDKPRFSNCFTEKRGSSIVVRCFSFFVAPDLFFKIFQKKQYLYIGQRFREHSPIKQACKHFQMPVVSYNSAFGEAALYCRTELIFYASAEMLFSCIVLPVGFLPLEWQEKCLGHSVVQGSGRSRKRLLYSIPLEKPC